jgi:acetylornithine aminotransferase
LGRVSGYEDYNLFLCNSGAEAVENALKMASFHNCKSKILAFEKGFHGRTMGALRVTDGPKIKASFNGTITTEYLPLNELEPVENALEEGNIAGIIVEGIQGVAGIIEPTTEFLKGLRELATKFGVVLILDEVQSGFGRTGDFFAHQHAEIKADVITMAKGMGNGFPIGGIILSPEFKASYGLLGTTFGGNHLACAACSAVLEVIEKENILEKNKLDVVSIERLKNRSNFLRTAKGKMVHKKAFVLQGRSRSDSSINIRIGFTCTKKVGNAVLRNLAKRRLREVAQNIFPNNGVDGWDYVLVGKKDFTAKLNFEMMTKDLTQALQQIHSIK